MDVSVEYFEVAVILDIQNLCQTIKTKFCLAGSEKMQLPQFLSVGRTISEK